MSLELTHQILEKIDQEKAPITATGITTSRKSPEQLVGLGFRFWIAGYQTKDFEFWRRTWDYFARNLGVETARATISDLAFWVQTVHHAAGSNIEISEWKSPQFNRDERMAITMIAAGQQNACPALTACAHALIGATQNSETDLEQVVQASNDFAHHLLANDLELQLQNAEPLKNNGALLTSISQLSSQTG